MLYDHSFLGNVRELENVLIRACDFSPGGIIQNDEISFDIIPETNQKLTRNKYKWGQIMDVMVKCGGNKTKAAKELGISRVQLYRLLNLQKTNRL